jgi:hypothetical protein
MCSLGGSFEITEILKPLTDNMVSHRIICALLIFDMMHILIGFLRSMLTAPYIRTAKLYNKKVEIYEANTKNHGCCKNKNYVCCKTTKQSARLGA